MRLIQLLTLFFMLSVTIWAADEKAETADSTETRTAFVESFELAQNYPNPFNPTTTIRFTIAEKSNVKIKVFNLLGNSVQILVDAEYEPGRYNISFDGSDLPAGIYLYNMTAGDLSEMKRMTLLK